MPALYRPVVLAVDDDPQVLRAVRRDLNRVYRDRYRVLASTSPAEALRLMDELKERAEEPALFLVDQRMPEMTGVELLKESLARFPSARRVLLTAYADTQVAIDAINAVRLDYYLVKPWEPPEDRLYPVLDGLLEDWRLSHRPPYDGIQIVGRRFAPATHRLRDFLTRHQQPFRFVDAEPDADPCALPTVLLSDGTRLARPGPAELAEVLRLSGDTARQPYYDVVIVGGGPAGLAAAVYSSSEGLSTLLVDEYAPGGQAGMSSRIENYLGFPGGLSGSELTHRAVTQARRFGASLLSPVSAVSLRRAGRARAVALSDGREVIAGAVLVATGLSYRRLDAEGAAAFEGAGIYYGAAVAETSTCAGRHVWIVGGGNSAGQAALHLARHAKQVTVLVRAGSLDATMSHYLVEEIEAAVNIEVCSGTSLVAVEGDGRLRRITLRHVATGETTAAEAEFVFVFIGASPHTDWLGDAVRRDRHGFILTGPDLGPAPGLSGWDLPREPLLLETSVPGVFAAGDVRAGSMKRIAAGVGEGAMATALIHRYRADS